MRDHDQPVDNEEDYTSTRIIDFVEAFPKEVSQEKSSKLDPYFYKKLINHIDDAIVVLDKNLRVVYYNRKFYEILERRLKKYTAFPGLLTDKGSKAKFYRMVRDLREISVGRTALSIQGISEAHGCDAAASRHEDFLILTIKVRRETEMSDLMKIHEDRINTIQNINSQLSHEIRSPLSVVEMNLEYCHNHAITCPTQKRAGDIISPLEEALLQVRYVTSILHNLSKYSKMGHNIKEEIVNVKEVLETTVDILRRASDLKGLGANQFKLSTSKMDDPSYAKINKIWLSQVIWNLCTNAYEAISPDGKICVKGSTTEDFVFIRVINTGRISEDIEKLFSPYFSSKENSRGLGLAIVR